MARSSSGAYIAAMTQRIQRPGHVASRRRVLACAGSALAGLAFAGTAHAQNVREGDLDGKPVFFPLNRIVISIFRGKTVERHDMLLLRLELMNTSAITPVELAMPRLRDAFVRIWSRLGARPDAADKGLDFEAGRRAMRAACDEIAGPGLVKAVLLIAHSSRRVKHLSDS
jgi:hypothetical protein